MESLEINFIPKPEISAKDLEYINNQKQVYANLFEIKIKKPLTLYQYPYEVSPEIEAGDLRIREKIFKYSLKQIKAIYGESFFSGDSVYGMNKVEEIKEVKCKIYGKGCTEYTVTINPCVQERTIKEQDIQKDQLSKQFIEILINDILHHNPRLDFYKGLFVIRDREEVIETDRVKIKFYPGYTTSFMETDAGNYLNVTLKNKIIESQTILEFLKQNKHNDKKNHDRIKELLIGRSFKVSYAKRNYVIDDILFDRNPQNQQFNEAGGRSVNLVSYYENHHKITIKDKSQPLILVKRKGAQGEEVRLYFIPELCSLAGLDDGATKDGQFMRELANFTKLNPPDRIAKTNEFLSLLTDKSKDPKHPDIPSAFDKSMAYGIEVTPLNKLFTAYYMEETKLVGGGGKAIKPSDKIFPVLDRKEMTRWVCFYEEGKNNYKDAENLYNNLVKAAKGYKFDVAEPEWVELPQKSSAKDWIDTAGEYVGNGKKDYDFAVFLLGKFTEKYYKAIKTHSLCKSGYVSQVVKGKSLMKNALSVCSKILLQLNAKMEGASYKTKISKSVDDRKLMIIGIDSSHVQGKRTGVGMVASVNDSFTNFFNKEQIIKEENKEQLQFCVSSFIDEALSAYLQKNRSSPKGIIIYRQGVSLQQKEFLKEEIRQINEKCKEKNICYYYILVNTKTTYKFFEKGGGSGKRGGAAGFHNPEAGLLIIDGVTNRNFFEFYIQPQEVTGGSATPTCFHVAYGNMNFPEIIPKLTYDLCHIYSNWQGPVRIPNAIKCAEKLSKMTAKYTCGELHKDLKFGQPYL